MLEEIINTLLDFSQPKPLGEKVFFKATNGMLRSKSLKLLLRMIELNCLSILNFLCVGWATYKRSLRITIGFLFLIGRLDLLSLICCRLIVSSAANTLRMDADYTAILN